jgi:hypothetical protein
MPLRNRQVKNARPQEDKPGEESWNGKTLTKTQLGLKLRQMPGHPFLHRFGKKYKHSPFRFVF